MAGYKKISGVDLRIYFWTPVLVVSEGAGLER